MAVTEDGLRAFFEEELAIGRDEIAADTLLFSSGLIDSFSLVGLLGYLETSGGFTIEPEDVNLENFDSLDRILAYVARQQDMAAGEATV
jgi:acyl carrier protein